MTTSPRSVLAVALLSLCALVPLVASAESVIDSQVIPFNLGMYGGQYARSYGYESYAYACWPNLQAGTQVSVNYAAEAVDATTGASVCGTAVPVGTNIMLQFKPHVPTDIFWNFTGYSYGTPYGQWSTTGDYAPWNTQANVCTPDHFIHAGVAGEGGYFGVFADLIVNTPQQDISLSGSGLVCQSPDRNGNRTCTATAEGSVTAQFNIHPTTGRIYAGDTLQPSADTPTQNQISCLGFSYESKVSDYDPTGLAGTWHWCADTNPYDIPIQQHTISCPITIVNPQIPPVRPTISGNGSCVVGQPFTISVVATASNNHLLRYGIDWLNDGSITEWAPEAPNYVTSGTAVTVTRTYSTAGQKTIGAYTQDDAGARSTEATFTFNCAEAQNSCNKPPICQDTHTVLDQCTGNTTTCAANEQCLNGVCTANSCLATYSCQDAHTIVNSCTGETTACAQGEKCVNGACVADVCTPIYTCSGSSIIDSCTGNVTHTCTAPQICSAGACVLQAPSGTFSVLPSLVSSGDTAALSWNVHNVVSNSCSISGTDGEHWSNQPSVSSPSLTSAPIYAATTFTLSCKGLDGSTFSLSKQVNLLPRYQER